MKGTYPDNFEYKIGFDRIREMLRENCLSLLGEERVEGMQFETRHAVLVELLGETDEFKRILIEFPGFPINYFFDVRKPLERIRTEGRYIETEELFDLKRCLDTLKSIIRFFDPGKASLLPLLTRKVSRVRIYPYLHQRIDAILNKSGEIRDQASPELSSIRRQMAGLQSGISKRLQAILKQAQKEGWVEEGTSVSIRDGRAVIPVASAHKRKIKGIVYDESATGKTSYIEPAEIVEMNNEIRELENAERREIIRILTLLSNDFRPYIDDLIYSNEFLGEIDFIRSKALFARTIDAIKPDIANSPRLDWKQALHPLLMISLKRENRKIVPLDITLTEDNHLLVISGPNAGGKSVCLKSVGLIQYMLQNGMLVPLQEGSKTGIFERIFIDIGDEQSIENDLSTYSSHLLNMKFFLRHSDELTLLLIDEFGTGTEPMLGGAIAEAVLNQLNQQKAYGVITTHYTNLKYFAASEPGIVNGAMLYDAQRMNPLFILEIGKPGSSFAFEIARKIGLPETILEKATEKVGKKHINFEKNLRSITRDKFYWESKREKIRKVEKSVGEMAETYLKELEELRSQRNEILRNAREEARQMLAGVNRQIEQTIREIRESQAEKERTREVRQGLEELRRGVQQDVSDDDLTLARKKDKLRNLEKRRLRRKPPELAQVVPVKEERAVLVVGDSVRIAGQEAVGELIDVNERNGVIAFGQLISTVPLSRIEKVEGKAKSGKVRGRSGVSMTLDFSEKRMNFKPEIDLRGERTEAALSRIQTLIDEAVMFEVRELRILHGKGEGILKEMIRAFLRAEPLVCSFRDEDVRFGGAGITVVELSL